MTTPTFWAMPPTTGWMNLTPTAEWALAAAAPVFRVRRDAYGVTFQGRLQRITTGSSRVARSVLWAPTAGFTPSSFIPLGDADATAATGRLIVNTWTSRTSVDVTALTAGTWTAGENIAFEVTWHTDDPMPTL